MRKILLLVSVFVFCWLPAVSQTTVTTKAHPDLSPFATFQLDSKLMARKMPYRVVLPPGYSEVKGMSPRYAVVYLLHGLTGHYTNWTDKTQLGEYGTKHNFIIVTPEGDNGWYTDSVATPSDKYESYVIKELIPEIDKNYRTVADREHRMIAGLSMGGYGSLKFGLKYSEMFSLIGSFSGALAAPDLDKGIPPNQPPAGFLGVVQTSIGKAFGPQDSESRRSNDIFKMARELTPEKVKALPYIFESCGTEDGLIGSNRDFLAILNDKKVPHEYREHPGIHDWVFWNDQVREFLDLAERRLKK